MPPNPPRMPMIHKLMHQSEPTRGEKLAEKYERRFDRNVSAGNHALALEIALEIARKFEAAALDFVGGGDVLALLHRYEQGFRVIPYASELPRRQASIAAQNAAQAMRHSAVSLYATLGPVVGRWAGSLKFGPPQDAISAALHANLTFRLSPAGRTRPCGAPDNPKWQPFHKPPALTQFQNALVGD